MQSFLQSWASDFRADLEQTLTQKVRSRMQGMLHEFGRLQTQRFDALEHDVSDVKRVQQQQATNGVFSTMGKPADMLNTEQFMREMGVMNTDQLENAKSGGANDHLGTLKRIRSQAPTIGNTDKLN